MKDEISTIYPEDYPSLLKNIPRQPKHLNIIGSLPPANYIYLCVIGARKHSSYGKDACNHLIQGLRGYPIAIVSGLALGIDSIAHEAAISVQLPTIAFPGSGLSPEVLYPYSKKALAEKIVRSGGAIVSAFNKEQSGTYWTFPERNRLMAGISKATLIIEGRQGSGTLGTAEYATQFNRDLMIVPGSIFSELSYGPHLLMRDGAHPVTNAKEILSILELSLNPSDVSNNQKSLWSKISYSPLEKAILEQLQSPLPRDELIRNLKISLSQFNATLSELEIKGLITDQAGIIKINHQ